MLCINNKINSNQFINVSIMKESNKCACSTKNKEKNVKAETMVVPDDVGKMNNKNNGESNDESVEESVVMVNPDADSMGSRG